MSGSTAQRQMWNAGCLVVLAWVVILAIALELSWWLVVSVLHQFGVF